MPHEPEVVFVWEMLRFSGIWIFDFVPNPEMDILEFGFPGMRVRGRLHEGQDVLHEPDEALTGSVCLFISLFNDFSGTWTFRLYPDLRDGHFGVWIS